MCQTVRHEHRKARKEHRCTWCGQKILAGEKYHFFVVIYEGEAQSNKFHPECEEDLQAAITDQRGGCFEFLPGEQERPKVMNETPQP